MKTSNRGMTLIELMVGMAIGLVATLAIMTVLINAEEGKRTITSGMDAQVTGSLALTALEKEVSKAGYGFSAIQDVVGCPLANKYGGSGSGLASMPAALVPVSITAGINGLPDSVRVVASNKSSFSVPITTIAPSYTAGSAQVYLSSVRGIKGPTLNASGVATKSGDLLILATDSVTPCQMFSASADPIDNSVQRTDDAKWNPSGWPSQTYDYGSYLINLGSLRDVTYSVDVATGDLQQTSLVLQADGSAAYSTFTLYNNVVQMRAYYGKDTDADGAVNSWDASAPTTNAGWLQIVALRLAVVTRGTQYEKAEVTASSPEWNVGTVNPPTAAVTCSTGSGKCITLKLDYAGAPADWKHYRYKVFDTVIPLRNVIWKAS